MRYKERTSNSFKIMALFQRFEMHWSDDLSEMTAEVRVSEDFEYIINRLEADFTQFELKQFTNIRSSYAKRCSKAEAMAYSRKKEYPVDEFREMLQVPKSYRATDINQVVLKPIKEELSEYFVGLKVKPIKAKNVAHQLLRMNLHGKLKKLRNGLTENTTKNLITQVKQPVRKNYLNGQRGLCTAKR